MRHKFRFLIAIALLVLATVVAVFLLPRFLPSSAPAVTLSPAPLVSLSPTPLVSSSIPPPTIAWDDLPTVTPPAPGEPTLPPEALAMRAAPTATPSPIPPPPSPMPTPTPIPTPVPSTGHDDVPMVEVPAGEFLMGNTREVMDHFWWEWYEKHRGYEYWDEFPRLRVYLDTFSIDKVEVTNARYHRCVEAGVCPPSALPPRKYSPPSDYTTNTAYDDYPVYVSWFGANVYCQWVGKRLPTEAGWEKAARGTDGRQYPWGDEWDESRTLLYAEPQPVGSHPEGASPYSALDMIGNALEWTVDLYTLYPGAEQIDPDLPFVWADRLTGGLRIVRGGWDADLAGGRVAVRLAYSPEFDWIGFRCVEGPEPVPLEDAVVQIVDPIPTSPPTLVPIPQPDLSDAVYIPAGEFLMGSDEGLDDPHRRDEAPAHVVYLDAFYVDRTEVTVAEYVDFLNSVLEAMGVPGLKKGCAGYQCSDWGVAEHNHIIWHGERLGVDEEKYADYAVQRVSWYGANAYCRWVGGRLPTEAEWEKAARGTDGRRYPWGNEWRGDLLSQYSANPVGSKPGNASPYGVLDMLGSVWEWVVDYYVEDYYACSPYTNPPGPERESSHRGGAGGWRVVRGRGDDVGITSRYYDSPESSPRGIGFRCAYDAGH